MKRRSLILLSSAAAGALAVGWLAVPARARLHHDQTHPVPSGDTPLNGWLRIGSDGGVVLLSPKTEMGQGVHTGLVMLAAEELGVQPSAVRVVSAPVDAIYGNSSTVIDSLPFKPGDEGVLQQVMVRLTGKIMREAAPLLTGGSSSLKDLWLPLRLAAAAARTVLQQAAATRLGVPVAEVALLDGRLQHKPSGRSLGLGDVAADAATLPLPAEPALKPATQWRLIGHDTPRIDSSAKTRGSPGFGIDVRQDGQLFAAVQMAPGLSGRVESFDASAAKALPGVRAVLAFEPPGSGGVGGVAVVAASTWQALQAAQAVQVRWEAGRAQQADSETLLQRLAWAVSDDSTDTPYPHLDRGDVEATLASAPKRLDAVYTLPFMAHQALEPINATVKVESDRATVWAPTQAPDLAQGAVARALGLPREAVMVHVTWAGGGFGRRLEVDFIEQAALIARAMPGVPVQTLWTRAQDTRHDFYRPAQVARLRAGLDAQGRLVAWDHLAAGPLLTPGVMRRYGSAIDVVPTLAAGQALTAQWMRPLGALPGVALDKLSAEGAFDSAYAWPAARMRFKPVDTEVPMGFWRSVGHSINGFVVESFIDECAHAASADPLAFRLALLGPAPRHRAVLERASALAGWGQALGKSADGAPLARGLALHASFGSVVAMVVEVSIGPVPGHSNPRIRVHRVVAAIDCGVAVNPRLIHQQVESAVVYGLSATLDGAVRVEDGRVSQAHFADLPLLRLPEAPRVEVAIVPSPLAHPEGVGEPGVPPLAPAVANAVFALTGTRLRALPLRLPTPA